MDNENEGGPTPKRTDVGYKRPPIEHQFKPGHTRGRRKKRADKQESATQCLARILGEERRLKRGGKTVWCTNANLVVEIAFQLAEGGNAAVSRALADYMMAGDEPDQASDRSRTEYDPDGVSGVFNYTLRRRI